MANNPKKVKDPTEVALSAIQEALNIGNAGADANRNAIDGEVTPPTKACCSSPGKPRRARRRAFA